jgi:hypothetical protein
MSIYGTMAMAIVESFHYNCSPGLSVSDTRLIAGVVPRYCIQLATTVNNTVSSDAIRCRSH